MKSRKSKYLTSLISNLKNMYIFAHHITVPISNFYVSQVVYRLRRLKSAPCNLAGFVLVVWVSTRETQNTVNAMRKSKQRKQIFLSIIPNLQLSGDSLPDCLKGWAHALERYSRDTLGAGTDTRRDSSQDCLGGHSRDSRDSQETGRGTGEGWARRVVD